MTEDLSGGGAAYLAPIQRGTWIGFVPYHTRRCRGSPTSTTFDYCKPHFKYLLKH